MDPELHPKKSVKSLVYQAIDDDNLEYLKFLLENRIGVNEPIITTGEFAGFTALHVACMKNRRRLVESLVNDYKADVNATAVDGTEPIFLACFYEPPDRSPIWYLEPELCSNIKTLVQANANVNAEFGQEIFSKHVKAREWCPDFGDKMPIVAYSIIYDKPIIIYFLNNVNLDIISLTNKTLLMYAVENSRAYCLLEVMVNIENPELMEKLVNHRDNDDVPLTHYPFHPKKNSNFRHNMSEFHFYHIQSTFISDLASWGADLNALINNDPATFLPNLAAYGGWPLLLEDALPYYTSMALSKVLYYASLPVDENSDHLAFADPEFEPILYLKQIRKHCIIIALKDLVFRNAFKLPVPKEETKLMHELMASDSCLRWIVEDYKTNFIEKELKKSWITFGDNRMTMYDILMQIFDEKKIKFLVREKHLLDTINKVFSMTYDVYSFHKIYHNPIMARLRNTEERLRLLENLKKIPSLREAIPLPFELVLEIVEYLSNKHLKAFIKAFYI